MGVNKETALDLGLGVKTALEGLDWRTHEAIREISATYVRNEAGDLVPEIRFSIAEPNHT
jgi:hypothetical protein